jgi:hypothetical protein
LLIVSPALRPSWPLSGRNSTYPAVQVCQASSFLVRLLHAGGLQILQDHLGEGLFSSVFVAVLLETVDQFVVLIHAEHAVGTEALDGEWTGDADYLFVLVGLVVEVFEFGLCGDACINFTSRRATSLLVRATPCLIPLEFPTPAMSS